jgi:hypothetical protein
VSSRSRRLPWPEIGELVEAIVHPAEKDVVGGERLEERREIDVAVDERLEFLEAGPSRTSTSIRTIRIGGVS